MDNCEPKPAATVVFCKITTQWPHKILLIQRKRNAAFLPGAHVFPGGRVDQSDSRLARLIAADTTQLQRIQSSFSQEDKKDLALYVAAAIRETYEESGLSILRSKMHEQVSLLDSKTLKRLLFDTSFTLKKELELCLKNIWPISWWITPQSESRRYDTLFFLALGEISENVSLNPHESCEHRWLSPIEALNQHETKEIFLAPPTRSILERMATTKSLEDFLSYVDRPIRPIRPYFVNDKDNLGPTPLLVLPGDPLHREKEPSRLPMTTRYIF